MPITQEIVWNEITRRSFAVLSYVTPTHEARSAGIVYIVDDRKLYIQVAIDSWKAKHIRLNPHVALNVTIPKRVPFMPWIEIPQATIAIRGVSRVIDAVDADARILEILQRSASHEVPSPKDLSILEVTPTGHILTYGGRCLAPRHARSQEGSRPGRRLRRPRRQVESLVTGTARAASHALDWRASQRLRSRVRDGSAAPPVRRVRPTGPRPHPIGQAVRRLRQREAQRTDRATPAGV